MGLTIKDRIEFPGAIMGPDSVLTHDEAKFFQSTAFTPTELTKYKKIFNSLDFDMDGSISQADLLQAFKNLGFAMKQEEISAAISEVDLNKSGSIEFWVMLKVD